MLTKIKNEPVMTAVVVLSIILAVLVQTGRLTIEDINEFAATVALVFPLVLGGFGLRALVSPVRKAE